MANEDRVGVFAVKSPSAQLNACFGAGSQDCSLNKINPRLVGGAGNCRAQPRTVVCNPVCFQMQEFLAA